MVLYNCDICNYSTIRKNQYQRHLNTKKHLKKVCDNGISDDNKKPKGIEKISLKCPFCSKIFNKNTLLAQHLTDFHIKELTISENSSSDDIHVNDNIHKSK